MLVGVDFDNTIVCYDRLFHTLAVERGLIPPDVPTNKTAVRDYLRKIGREDDWTELQGVAYGPEIGRAEPFPGVLDFFRECKRRGVPTVIVSHKTLHPYRGEKHDLHAAARSFLRLHGFLDEAATGLGDANVFLELTKDAKLARIATAGCTHFVDDLPEFLGEPSFPPSVERILFDPEQRYPADTRWSKLVTWRDAVLRLPSPLAGEGPGVRGEPPQDAVMRLLASANLPTSGYDIVAIPGGGNNRGYRLTTSDGRPFFLKWYFRHPDDPRDRLGTEFAFTSFCRRHGIDEVPEPYARDEASGAALYEFIAGRRLTPEEIDRTAVDAATSFFLRLNEHRDDPDAAALPIASEACFSIQEHLDRIGGRIERLVAAAAQPDADAAFRSFVERRLSPNWDRLRTQIAGAYERDGNWTTHALSPAKRCLSPSDFGFHNALRMPGGRLRFIDLEYAGWDDPAKTVCDFFCQVQAPVPALLSEYFVDALRTKFGAGGDFDRRCLRLRPAYQMKWCCIALNVFLPTGSARRTFGTAQPATPERRAEQLQKAVDIYNRISLDFGATDYSS